MGVRHSKTQAYPQSGTLVLLVNQRASVKVTTFAYQNVTASYVVTSSEGLIWLFDPRLKRYFFPVDVVSSSDDGQSFTQYLATVSMDGMFITIVTAFVARRSPGQKLGGAVHGSSVCAYLLCTHLHGVKEK